MRCLAPNRLSLIFDESEWNNCFIIYTRSEFMHRFCFSDIFNIFLFCLFLYLRSFGRLFFQECIFLTILNFKNGFIFEPVNNLWEFFIVFLIL
jgi:hypothetical protein